MDAFDRQGVEMVPPLAPFPSRHHQAGAFQHLQMLHHRAAVHIVETLAQSAGGDRTIFQAVQHLSTTRVRQRLENTIIFYLV